MEEEQKYLREQVRRLKWQENISYKTIAEELLDMNYNAFINFVNGYKRLGYKRIAKLRNYINDML